MYILIPFLFLFGKEHSQQCFFFGGGALLPQCLEGITPGNAFGTRKHQGSNQTPTFKVRTDCTILKHFPGQYIVVITVSIWWGIHRMPFVPIGIQKSSSITSWPEWSVSSCSLGPSSSGVTSATSLQISEPWFSKAESSFRLFPALNTLIWKCLGFWTRLSILSPDVHVKYSESPSDFNFSSNGGEVWHRLNIIHW